MVASIFPLGMVAAAEPSADSGIPPAPGVSPYELLEPAITRDVVGSLANAADGPTPVMAPAAYPASMSEDERAEQRMLQARGQIRDYFLPLVDDEKDLELPLLDFLTKYPAFKQQFAQATGIPILAAPQYRFTAEERQYLEARINFQAHRTNAPWTIHYWGQEAGATIAPMTHTEILFIDDDGSSDQGGPAFNRFEFTDAGPQLSAALNASGYTHDYVHMRYGGTSPDFGTMSQYSVIIYSTGQNWFGYGPQLLRRFTGFVEAEGDLWLAGQMSIIGLGSFFNETNSTMANDMDAETLDFFQNFMGVQSYQSMGIANPMNGTAAGFLSGQQYTFTKTMRENLTAPPVTATQFLDYSTHINTSGISQGLTIGTSMDRGNVTQNNVVNNVRAKGANKGVVITSAFEFAYFDSSTQLNDFVGRVGANITANPGLVYDATTDVAAVAMEIAPTHTGFAGGQTYFFDRATGNILAVAFQFSIAIERFKPTHFNLTIDNYRNAVFQGDPKVELTGVGNAGWTGLPDITSANRIENITRAVNTNISAASTFNLSVVFYPHRMWLQQPHGQATTIATDGNTANNQLFLGFVVVLGYFEGGEPTPAANVSINTTSGTAWARQLGAANAFTENGYFEASSGPQRTETSIELPWMDVRSMNQTGVGNFWFWDHPVFHFMLWGEATGGDALYIEFRNDSRMSWTEDFNFTGNTDIDSPADGINDWVYYFGPVNTGPNGYQGFDLGLAPFGVPVPAFNGDKFVQMRLRWVANANSASLVRIDDISWYSLTERNVGVDFIPTLTNGIAAPSPRYTVTAGSTTIAQGTYTGPITINETETVTFSAGLQDPQQDSFTYAWSQVPTGFVSLPSDGTTPRYSASVSHSLATSLTTYEGLTSGGRPNSYSVIITATDELNLVSILNMTVFVRDAVPQWTRSDLNFSVAEDSILTNQNMGADRWFTDPEGTDLISITGVSPSVGGFPTITLSQNGSNGPISLRASSPDWFGLTNVTVTACDNKGSCAVQVILVTVTPVNDMPRFDPVVIAQINASARGPQNQPLGFSFAFWDVDDAAATLTYTVTGNHVSSWVVAPPFATGDPNRMIFNLSITEFEATNAVVGGNFFNITFCDPSGACVTVMVRATIDNVNDRPAFNSSSVTRFATQGTRFVETIVATDPDDLIPGQGQTQLLFTDDTNMFEIGSQSGVIDFTPNNADVTQGIQITIRVTDGQFSVPLIFTLVINNTNDAPLLPASGPDIVVNQGQQYVSTDIVATDVDLALYQSGVSESLSYTDDTSLFVVETVRSDKPSGEPQYLARINFQPTNDQVGTWFANITVTDASGATSKMRLRIVVNNLNDNPVGVKINITDQEGTVRAVTIPNQKVPYDEGDSITMQVTADDPDLRMRLNDPTQKVDPNERITCTVSVTFTGSLDVPQADTVKPTIDPDTCLSEFSPGNNEVGTFTIVVTVRDQSQASTSFRFQVEVKNVNQPPIPRVVAPLDNFNLKDTDTLQLSAVATDPDTPESLLQFTWRIEIVGGQVYNANGKTAQVQVANADTGSKQVKISLKVTDNLDAAVPLEASLNATGTIAGHVGSPGFEGPAVIAGMLGAVAVAALVGSRRRRQA